MGEEFGQKRPGDGSQRHGIDRNGRHHKRHHQYSCESGKIAGAKDEIDQSQAAGTNKHQRAAPPFLDGIECDKGEHHIGDTRDDNIDEHAIHVEASSDKYLLGIVEDDIGATPLLEHGHHQSEQQHPTITGFHQLAESGLLLTAIRLGLSLQLQKHRTLGNEETHQQEEGSRQGLGPEHPAPPPLHIPCLALSHCCIAGQEQVDHLGSKNTEHDGHLVETHHAATYLCGAYLGNIHGSQGGCHTDAHTTHKTGYIK